MVKNLKRIPYKFDILILTLLLVISIIEKLHIGILSYRHGLKNLFSISPMFLIFIYEPLKVSVVILAIFRFVYVKHVKKLNKYFYTAILSIILFIGSWLIPFLCFSPGAVTFLQGYEKWVEKNVDIKAIQTWLLSGDADKYVSSQYGDNLPDDFPDFMTNFEPRFITFNTEYSKRGKSIQIETGLGLNIWGIVIGLPTTKTKQQGRIEEPGSSYVEYRRPIIPGVYIFDGG